MKNERIKSIVKKIALKGLSATGYILLGLYQFFDDLYFMRDHQSLCQAMSVSQARAYIAECESYRRGYNRAYYRLKEKQWIESRKIGQKAVMVLTQSGEVAAIELILKYNSSRLPHKEYCMVVFDIPEAAHAARDKFRNMLKRIGFSYHQRSVWCIEKDVGKGIQRIVEIMKIKRWVRIYNAREESI